MKEVKVSEAVKNTVQSLQLQRNLMDNRLQFYLQGCMDTLNLKGDWNFDSNTCSFVKRPKEKKNVTSKN